MPTWPTFECKPMSSTSRLRRPAPRTDRAAMAALHWWFSWKRQKLPPDRRTQAVESVLADLDPRGRQMVEMWLADVGDRMICERTGMPRQLIADVRFAVLAAVAERLAAPKAPKRQQLPDRDALEAELRELEAQFLADGERFSQI